MPATARETVTHVPVSKLKPNPWGLEVGPPLSVEDDETLRTSISKSGIQTPLIVWKRGKGLLVLSGSNRLRVAKELGLRTVPVIVREFADRNAAKMFALSDNLARRHLTTGQRAYLAYQYQQLLTVGKGKRTDLEPLSNSTKVNARQVAAERAGVSGSTVSAMKLVVESGDDELLKSVLNGDKTLHAAVHAVHSNGRPEKPPRLTLNQRQTRADSTTLIHGDSRKELKKLAAASVDAIVTDPPYPCIDRAYGRMSETAWLDMTKAVVMECRRVLKPRGSAVFILQPNSEKLGRMRPWIYEFVAWACREWNVVQDAYWWAINTLPLGGRDHNLMRRSVKWLVWLGAPDCYRCQDRVLWDVSNCTATLNWEDRFRRRVGGHPSGHTIRWQQMSAASLERGGCTPYNLLPCSAAATRAEHYGHPATTPYAIADWWAKYILPSGWHTTRPVRGFRDDVGGGAGQRGEQGDRYRQGSQVPSDGGEESEGRLAPCQFATLPAQALPEGGRYWSEPRS